MPTKEEVEELGRLAAERARLKLEALAKEREERRRLPFNYLRDAECGLGWYKLVMPLVKKCEELGVEIVQVKEKFGGLRFYTGGAHEVPEYEYHLLHETIAEAENKSYNICEECGWHGATTRGPRWLKTLCEFHHAERDKRFAEQNLNDG